MGKDNMTEQEVQNSEPKGSPIKISGQRCDTIGRCVVCQDNWSIKHLAEMKIEKVAQLNPPLCRGHIEEISDFLRAKLDKKKKAETKTEVIFYCECEQAVRLRKRDNTWVHYGYNRIHEPYSDFLERTNHPVVVVRSQRCNV